MEFRLRKPVIAVVAAVTILAGCATPPPPPPPPPPPVIVPPRPLAPGQASANVPVPFMGANGVRQTVNANLTANGAAWNLRSAFNVAALNCTQPVFLPITDAYRSFLKVHQKQLTAINKAVDAEFKERYGAQSFHTMRDAYATQTYNYFALPPATIAFCNAALRMSQLSYGVTPGNLIPWSLQELPQIEQVFEDFFRAYEQWRVDVYAWDQKWGPVLGVNAPPPVYTTPPPMPGYVPAPAVVTIPVAPSAAAPTGGVVLPPAATTPPATLPSATPAPATTPAARPVIVIPPVSTGTTGAAPATSPTATPPTP